MEPPALRRVPVFRPGHCAVHVEARPRARERGVDSGESGLAVWPALGIAGEHRKAAEARCQNRSLQRQLRPSVLPPHLSLLTPHVHHSDRRHDCCTPALTTCRSAGRMLGPSTRQGSSHSASHLLQLSAPKDQRSS